MSGLGAFRSKIRPADEIVNQDAPVFQIVPYCTGGLHRLYHLLHTDSLPQLHDHGYHTSNDGHFNPKQDCFVGLRYKVKKVLDTNGQSSVVVLAEDIYCGNRHVVLKVLHTHYYNLGIQECHTLSRLAKADPLSHSHTLTLLNALTFDGHYCLVFEPLVQKPLTKVFLDIPQHKVLDSIRRVGVRLIASLGFLHQNNYIHTDVKPENILLKKAGDLDSVYLIDFGNAIHYVHSEVSLYYKDFELQTPLYRAPEVIYGVPFGPEIDMWSLGCVLAEIYQGKPLFYGNNKVDILQKMTALLGLAPGEHFRRGKYYNVFEDYTSDDSTYNDATMRLLEHIECRDVTFANLLAGLLKYNPEERLTSHEAALHPFFASYLPLRFLLPHKQGKERGYPAVPLDENVYTFSPKIDTSIKKRNPSSTELLRMGTSELLPLNETSVLKPSPRHGRVKRTEINDGAAYNRALCDRNTDQKAMSPEVSDLSIVRNTIEEKEGGRLSENVKDKMSKLLQAIREEQNIVEEDLRRRSLDAVREAGNQWIGQEGNQTRETDNQGRVKGNQRRSIDNEVGKKDRSTFEQKYTKQTPIRPCPTYRRQTTTTVSPNISQVFNNPHPNEVASETKTLENPQRIKQAKTSGDKTVQIAKSVNNWASKKKHLKITVDSYENLTDFDHSEYNQRQFKVFTSDKQREKQILTSDKIRNFPNNELNYEGTDRETHVSVRYSNEFNTRIEQDHPKFDNRHATLEQDQSSFEHSSISNNQDQTRLNGRPTQIDRRQTVTKPEELAQIHQNRNNRQSIDRNETPTRNRQSNQHRQSPWIKHSSPYRSRKRSASDSLFDDDGEEIHLISPWQPKLAKNSEENDGMLFEDQKNASLNKSEKKVDRNFKDSDDGLMCRYKQTGSNETKPRKMTPKVRYKRVLVPKTTTKDGGVVFEVRAVPTPIVKDNDEEMKSIDISPEIVYKNTPSDRKTSRKSLEFRPIKSSEVRKQQAQNYTEIDHEFSDVDDDFDDSKVAEKSHYEDSRKVPEISVKSNYKDRNCKDDKTRSGEMCKQWVESISKQRKQSKDRTKVNQLLKRDTNSSLNNDKLQNCSRNHSPALLSPHVETSRQKTHTRMNSTPRQMYAFDDEEDSVHSAAKLARSLKLKSMISEPSSVNMNENINGYEGRKRQSFKIMSSGGQLTKPGSKSGKSRGVNETDIEVDSLCVPSNIELHSYPNVSKHTGNQNNLKSIGQGHGRKTGSRSKVQSKSKQNLDFDSTYVIEFESPLRGVFQ